MPKMHSIELLPDAAGMTVIRRSWQALNTVGLPSMLDHTKASNAPHVTCTAVPELDPADERLAAELFAPLLPIRAELSGLVILGEGKKVILARLVSMPDAAVSAVLQLREATGGHSHAGWLPHVTLGRRIPREHLPLALDALRADSGLGADRPEPIVWTSLRRWNPETSETYPL